MSEVAFHFNVPDKLAYACRVLRKAVGADARVVVHALPEDLQALDEALWSFSSVDFIPHALWNAPADLLAASPVVLMPDLTQTTHQHILLNLAPQVPAGFERFERVIEVVPLDDTQRQQARQRWKTYTEAGHPIVRHDLALKGAH